MLTVQRVSGRWRVGHVHGAKAGTPSNDDEAARAVYPADGAALWRLELSKTARALGAGESARLRAFARGCRAAPNEIHVLGTHGLGNVTPPPTVLRALSGELKLRHGALDALLVARFFAAAIVALGAVLIHFLTALARNSDALSSSRAIPVMHGEDMTRTRHLIGALAAASYDGDVIVVGRSRISMRRFGALLHAHGVFAKTIRPFDRDALWRAFLSAPLLLMSGYRIARTHPSDPNLRELCGICYRMVMGRAMSTWLKRQPFVSDAAIFAHTGVGDTGHLELALQQRRTPTLHWVHGVSAGVNFQAYSSIGVFQTEHDARWHEALGGYGRTYAKPLAQPPFRGRGGRWLALSNLIHPMNPIYRRHGARSELLFLQAVSEAARARKHIPSSIIWKPHPVFANAPQHIRREVLDKALALGIELWPEGQVLGPETEASLVIATPSTVAIDMMCQGLPTVILAIESISPGTVYERFRYVAHDGKTLASITALAQTEEAFDASWRAIGPAGRLSWNEVVALAAAQRAPPRLESARA